jgi:hypothetical protein
MYMHVPKVGVFQGVVIRAGFALGMFNPGLFGYDKLLGGHLITTSG